MCPPELAFSTAQSCKAVLCVVRGFSAAVELEWLLLLLLVKYVGSPFAKELICWPIFVPNPISQPGLKPGLMRSLQQGSMDAPLRAGSLGVRSVFGLQVSCAADRLARHGVDGRRVKSTLAIKLEAIAIRLEAIAIGVHRYYVGGSR